MKPCSAAVVFVLSFVSVASAIAASSAAPQSIVFFAIVNQTGRPIHIKASVDGRALFERPVPAMVPRDRTVPPPGPYPVVELKAPLPRDARRLRIMELTKGTARTFAIAGFSATGAGFRIIVTRSGIALKQDYYPVR